MTRPTDRHGPLVARGVLGLLLVASAACSKQLPHGGDDPLWPLVGKHAGVPCEGCHGPGTPQTLPTACVECHDEDRPSAAHFPGQDCARCHTPEGWDVGVTGTHTGDTGTTPPTHTGTTVTDHPNVAPTQLCWDCHETDRKDDQHYKDATNPAKSWDCGPCHGSRTSWLDELVSHPARTPHGTFKGSQEQPPASWVVACAACHPASYDLSVCSQTCHSDLAFPHYTVAAPDAAGDLLCLGCHTAGDK